MVTNTTNPVIGNRYAIEQELGRGGMGVVYRATDRLVGQHVALKRVALSSSQLDFASKASAGDSADFRVALAREFRTLASLRHPNIISVLDYGFDENGRPFYTMELLKDAVTIINAGQGQSVDVQVDLLVQVLQALAYLHRRGIVHRDLKPDNVLVVGGQVKVLDFGLAVAREHLRGSDNVFAGTFAYTAPEVIQGAPASEASDLYAVGVMTFQLFAGHHPFDTTTPVGSLIIDILNTTPDILALEVDERLRGILARLLAKRPGDRPGDAYELISLYAAAIDRPVPPETVTIRESYLQAAQFVGRDIELGRLTTALRHATDGHGSVWLIGGESGVGKSRLVDELRIHALVEGTLVLHGQAIAEGGAPYTVWRDVLRVLCLHTDLTDLEASVLKALLPDISVLLGYDVPNAPEIDPTANRDRLLMVIDDIFRRQPRPVLVILEDLHWTGEGLAVLAHLSRSVRERQLMLVGNYRIEERPELPTESKIDLEAGHVHLMRLDRLSSEAIADLSASMLGEETGRQEHIVDLLYRETEGNVFFIVEVVRALAEEAGQLAQVGAMTLPRRVYAEGMKTVVIRRLARVPEDAYSLLRLAAVAGRQLDLDVLKATLGGDPGLRQLVLNTWLSTCASAMVIEVSEDRWRFTHDKLREGLLEILSAEESSVLNRQVAEAIEEAHPDDPAQFAALAHHWREGGDKGKEAHYAGLAGEQALEAGAYHEAVSFLERALALTAEAAIPRLKQASYERQLGVAYLWLSQMDEAGEHSRRAAALLGYPVPRGMPGLLAGVLVQIGVQVLHRAWPDRFVGRLQSKKAVLLETISIYEQLITSAFVGNEAPLLVYCGFRSLNLAEAAGLYPMMARAYASAGATFSMIPMHGLADAYFRRAEEAAQVESSLSVQEWVSVVTGIYLCSIGRWDEAEERQRRGMEASGSLGHYWMLESTWLGQAFMTLQKGEFDRCKDLADRVYASASRRGDPGCEVAALYWEAAMRLRRDRANRVDEIVELLEASISAPGEVMNRMDWIVVHGLLAQARLRQGLPELAAQEAAKVAQLIAEVPQPTNVLSLEGYAGACVVYLALWEAQAGGAFRAEARQACRDLHALARIFPIGRPRAHLCQGWYDWLAGKPRKAHRNWQKSLAYAEELNMPYEQGLVHYEIGRHLPGDDPAREEHLQAAEAIFERLGAQWDLEQVRKALGAP